MHRDVAGVFPHAGGLLLIVICILSAHLFWSFLPFHLKGVSCCSPLSKEGFIVWRTMVVLDIPRSVLYLRLKIFISINQISPPFTVVFNLRQHFRCFYYYPLLHLLLS
jgi:hypothetical protein